jgi:hypothetical protein
MSGISAMESKIPAKGSIDQIGITAPRFTELSAARQVEGMMSERIAKYKMLKYRFIRFYFSPSK